MSIGKSYTLTSANVLLHNKIFDTQEGRSVGSSVDKWDCGPEKNVDIRASPRTNGEKEIQFIGSFVSDVQQSEHPLKLITPDEYVLDIIKKSVGKDIFLAMAAAEYKRTIDRHFTSQKLTKVFQECERQGLIAETKPKSRRWKVIS
jgi:hypothetical protein